MVTNNALDLKKNPLNPWMTPGLLKSLRKNIFARLTGPLSHFRAIIDFNFLKLVEEFIIRFAGGPNRHFTIVNSLSAVKTLGKHGKKKILLSSHLFGPLLSLQVF